MENKFLSDCLNEVEGKLKLVSKDAYSQRKIFKIRKELRSFILHIKI